MGIRYVFNERAFSSKKAVQEYIRKAVSECPYDVAIDEAHEHYLVFNAIVMNHLKGQAKRGCGIKHFLFVVGSIYKEKQLNVVRTDGTVETMSYIYSHIICETTDKQKMDLAFREAINDQVVKYRSGQIDKPACMMCGATDKGIHIDHIYPFSKLSADYVASLGDTQLEFVKNTVKRTYEFADPIEKDKWCQYHQTHATFQPLCPPCNIKKGAKLL